MARAPVSKTGGWGFESLHSCQAPRYPSEIPRESLGWGSGVGQSAFAFWSVSISRAASPASFLRFAAAVWVFACFSDVQSYNANEPAIGGAILRSDGRAGFTKALISAL